MKLTSSLTAAQRLRCAESVNGWIEPVGARSALGERCDFRWAKDNAGRRMPWKLIRIVRPASGSILFFGEQIITTARHWTSFSPVPQDASTTPHYGAWGIPRSLKRGYTKACYPPSI